MGMTIAEKILARNAGLDLVSPGDFVTVEPETIVLIDMNFLPGKWWEILHVADPDRIVVVFDHLVPAKDKLSAAAHAKGREFVKKFGIQRFHDVGRNQGIVHQIVGDYGYAEPGGILLCVDSHTCSAGAYNCAGRGVGHPDIFSAAATGKSWFQCSPTVRYELVGTPGACVTPKDVFLYMAGKYGDHSLQNIEFHGEAAHAWGMNERRALSTMCAEVGAEFAIFAADEKLVDHMVDRGKPHTQPLAADPDAKYEDTRTIDVSRVGPMVAVPHHVINNTRPVEEVRGTKIDQCFIGSCCNGTLDDIRIAAEIVEGKRVAGDLRFIVTPASQQVYREALDEGYVATLLASGAVVTSSACGACAGLDMGVLAAGETAISASTRNFKGRMGSPDAEVYLGSPATVAASALKGTITDPRSLA